MSPNRQKHAAQYRKIGQAISAHDREWRIALGLSPNPWGIAKSAGFDVWQIVTKHRMSKLERRSLEMDEEHKE